MFGRSKGGWSHEAVREANTSADKPADTMLTAGAQNITTTLLEKSGFSGVEANCTLAMIAAGYGANIMLAQLRDAGMLSESALDSDEAMEKLLQGYNTVDQRTQP